MEQVTVTGNENTRIEVVSISEIHQVIKTDEIPKAWSPLWSMDYSMMFASKAPVVWIYLMNLSTSIYISKPEPQHLTGLCGLEFDFVDEPDALCAELGKDSHVRMASVDQDLSSSVTAFVCIPVVKQLPRAQRLPRCFKGRVSRLRQGERVRQIPHAHLRTSSIREGSVERGGNPTQVLSKGWQKIAVS